MKWCWLPKLTEGTELENQLRVGCLGRSGHLGRQGGHSGGHGGARIVVVSAGGTRLLRGRNERHALA